jgi:hypothetical protein
MKSKEKNIMNKINNQVDEFMMNLVHPAINEINLLRSIIKNSNNLLIENIKWNAPNYSINNIDCITLKIFPVNKILLILHTGAKSKFKLSSNFITIESNLLKWASFDRAIVSFSDMDDINSKSKDLNDILILWVNEIFKSDI